MTLGQGSTRWSIPTIPRSHRTVNRSMWCAAKAAGSAAIRLRFAASEKAKPLNTARDISPAASPPQPVVIAAIGSRGASLRDIEDYELEHIYSDESVGDTESKRQLRIRSQPWPNRSRPSQTREAL